MGLIKLIKPVTFKSEGQQIIGVLHIPDLHIPDNIKHNEKVPGIIMLHGFTGNKIEAHRLFVKISDSLSKSGFIVLRFDFRAGIAKATSKT